jgi:predicted TIM-barrel fold metal-dependent hydrolase
MRRSGRASRHDDGVHRLLEHLGPFPAALRPRPAAVADRILLGTDFPNIPCPYLHQLEALARLEFGAPWLRAACHDNAARLLGR